LSDNGKSPGYQERCSSGYQAQGQKQIRDLKDTKDLKSASEQLPQVISMIDKLAKKGIIHKNKASNLKSKLARRVNTPATA
jgi:small subunit ribosomal protein S20